MDMGHISSIPKDSPLRCILGHWEKFSLDCLKWKTLKFICNTAMPQYKLENHETWPENGSLNSNSILQLDIFAKGRETRQKFITLGFHGP